MIAVGVDTHKDRHYAVALDHLGQMLAELTIAATAAGYAELQRWAEQLADTHELVFGIEGAGSWGAGLCQHLQRAGHSVLEVERPRRADRRAGKASTRSRRRSVCSRARASPRHAAAGFSPRCARC
jgi:transposase